MILAVALLVASALNGIDCSGKTDSGVALNAAFQNLSNGKLVIPSSCNIRSDVPLVIQGQESFLIEGEADRPVIYGGPAIFGCNGTAGPLLRINRSGFWTIRGIGIYPVGPASICKSNFTRSIDIDNTGSGGFTTTEGTIEHSALTSNVQGLPVANYIGINVIGYPNTERMEFRRNWIGCQNSPNSYGIRIAGPSNSDNDVAEGNNIAGCFQGIRQEGGNVRIVQNHFTDGAFSVFGAYGAAIYIGGCSSGSVNIRENESSDGNGPFLNSNNDQNGGCVRGFNISGNVVASSDIGPNQYPLNIGTTFVPYLITGNDFYITGRTTKSVMGSDSQNGCAYGPLGKLTDIANINSFPGNTGGWSGCSGTTLDFQGGHTSIGQ